MTKSLDGRRARCEARGGDLFRGSFPSGVCLRQPQYCPGEDVPHATAPLLAGTIDDVVAVRKFRIQLKTI